MQSSRRKPYFATSYPSRASHPGPSGLHPAFQALHDGLQAQHLPDTRPQRHTGLASVENSTSWGGQWVWCPLQDRAEQGVKPREVSFHTCFIMVPPAPQELARGPGTGIVDPGQGPPWSQLPPPLSSSLRGVHQTEQARGPGRKAARLDFRQVKTARRGPPQLSYVVLRGGHPRVLQDIRRKRVEGEEMGGGGGKGERGEDRGRDAKNTDQGRLHGGCSFHTPGRERVMGKGEERSRTFQIGKQPIDPWCGRNSRWWAGGVTCERAARGQAGARREVEAGGKEGGGGRGGVAKAERAEAGRWVSVSRTLLAKEGGWGCGGHQRMLALRSQGDGHLKSYELSMRMGTEQSQPPRPPSAVPKGTRLRLQRSKFWLLLLRRCRAFQRAGRRDRGRCDHKDVVHVWGDGRVHPDGNMWQRARVSRRQAVSHQRVLGSCCCVPVKFEN